MGDWSTARPARLPAPARRSLGSRAVDRDSPLWKLDWTLTFAVLALFAVGTMLVWSATRPAALAAGLSPNTYLKKNLLNISIALVLGVATMLVDYRLIRSYAPILYGLSVVGLLAVYLPHFGTVVNGARSWISVGGGFEVQPSEFAKLALILLVAMLLGDRREGDAEPTAGDIVLVLALAGISMLLIVKEPDLGQVLVIIFVVLGMIALSGVSTRWVLGLLAVGIIGALALVHLHLLKPYQIARLTSFANPHAATSSAAYNTAQAKIAVGSGGLYGKGLFHGTQTNGNFVPENNTDFIFTVAGEELGFVGAAVIVLLIGVVLWRALKIAADAADGFGMLVAVGVVCWFGFQAFENIGMTLGIMPVTGLPLPFVSYGGSSMFVEMIGIGLLQSIRIRALE
jgi:rod shape determining protein RodA